MAEAQLQQFLEKVRQLNAFVALSEAKPELRQNLVDCNSHHQVVSLAAQHGFSIGRRWGDPAAPSNRPSFSDQTNLLESICPPAGQKHTRLLWQQGPLRLEQIHSCQASTPEQGWYDQPESEWVLVLQGSARLRFDDEPEPRDLCAGDGLLISPHRRHRVLATDPAPGTIWLALFWSTGA